MRPRFTLRASSWLSGGVCLALVWIGCAEADTGAAGGRCSLASDCKSGLVCVFEACSVACKSQRDCKNGETCVRSTSGPVCKPRTTCARNSECLGTQVCARDATCRDECIADRDCNGGQLCVNAVCAAPADLVGGALPDKLGGGGLGAPCIISTDCPGDYVCLANRTCGAECLVDRDCADSNKCVASRAGGPGRCTPSSPTADAGPDGRSDASPDAAPPWPALLALAAGQSFTCAVLADGRVKCFGRNNEGQLGLGDTTNRGDQPNQMGDQLPAVNLGTNVHATSIAAGGFHVCALVDKGSGLKCWGANNKGQLGLGDANGRGAAANQMGDTLPFVNVGTGRTVKAVTLGVERTCALLDNGGVKCWGSIEDGAVGLEDAKVRGKAPGDMGDALPYVNLGAGRTVKALAAGALHQCAILDNDRLKCWGSGSNGAIGSGSSASRGLAVGDMGDNLPYVDLGTPSTVSSVAGGLAHSCAKTTDGRLLCWGYNGEGGLGLGDRTDRGNAPGQMGTSLPTVVLGTGRSVKTVALGFVHTCALLDNDRIKCFGGNQYGQLGLGETNAHGVLPNQMGDNLAYALLPAGRTVRLVAAGWEHTCAYLDSQELRCWGHNDTGQLGLGDNRDVGTQPGESGDLRPATYLTGDP